MMISNEQCREIAKKLRYTANYGLGGLSLQRNLAEITKAEGVSWRWVMRRLADLIDRPVTRNLSEKPEFVCELCGAVFPYDLGFTHCPECGAEVVYE